MALLRRGAGIEASGTKWPLLAGVAGPLLDLHGPVDGFLQYKQFFGRASTSVVVAYPVRFSANNNLSNGRRQVSALPACALFQQIIGQGKEFHASKLRHQSFERTAVYFPFLRVFYSWLLFVEILNTTVAVNCQQVRRTVPETMGPFKMNNDGFQIIVR